MKSCIRLAGGGLADGDFDVIMSSPYYNNNNDFIISFFCCSYAAIDEFAKCSNQMRFVIFLRSIGDDNWQA